MDNLFYKSENLVRKVTSLPTRNIMHRIHWNARLIGIKGSRGVGKTTLLLQRIALMNLNSSDAIFLSLDDWYFTNHSLIDTVEEFIRRGGKYIFLDEVHKYDGWAKQIKNLYDFYDIHIVFTGSSIIDISKEEGDLSRRAIMYSMQGLSFREYLNIEHGFNFPQIDLIQLLNSGSNQIRTIFGDDFKPYRYFDEYLKFGYYPFYQEGKEVYFQKIQQIVRQIVEVDMSELKGFDVRNAKKMLQLLAILAQSIPFKPNIQKLAEKMGMTRITLYNYFIFLEQANLINLLYTEGSSIAVLQKPEKIYFENTNLAFALAPESTTNIGNLRETFVYNQLKQSHDIKFPEQGDFLVDNTYTIEVGGKNKTNQQIQNIENSYRVLYNIEFTNQKNTIPLWLIGFEY